MEPNYAASLRVLKRDTHLAPFIKKYGHPDLRRYHADAPGVFQALLRSIVYQQLSGHAARAIHTRVVALFEDETPTPGALLKIHARKLRSAGLSVQKIEYVRDLARRFFDGTITPEQFPTMTSDQIIEHITVVKGIGEWTVHMLLIFTLHRIDILPTGDLGIRKGFQAVYGFKKLPSKKQMEQTAAPWRTHASIASWYLWRVADETKNKTD